MEPGASPVADKRRWTDRWISFFGFVVLCVAFFLPQAEGCRSESVPAREVAQGNSTCPLFLPFFVAFILAEIYILRWLINRKWVGTCWIIIGCAVCVAALAVGAWFFGSMLLDGLNSKDGSPPFSLCAQATGMVLLGLAAIVLSIVASMRRKLPLCVMLAGAGSVLYFSFWAGQALYGLWVSIAGSAIIAAGGLWETLRARPPQPPPAGSAAA